MIDSIYPGERKTSSIRKLLPSMPIFREFCAEETKVKVRRCLSLAVEMVGNWEMPQWGVKEEEVLRSAAAAGDSIARSTSAMPPPSILLRATDPLPMPAGVEAGTSSFDVHRGSKFLGWENYGDGGGYDLVKAVADVPGHHFNLFQDQNNATAVTEKVRWACDLIDRD